MLTISSISVSSVVVVQIATDYGTDPSLTSLLDTMDIYMLILTNPDGYAYSHSNVCRLRPVTPPIIFKTRYTLVLTFYM